MKSANLSHLEPSGPVQVCAGIASTFHVASILGYIFFVPMCEIYSSKTGDFLNGDDKENYYLLASCTVIENDQRFGGNYYTYLWPNCLPDGDQIF
jgi:hypothetical protein